MLKVANSVINASQIKTPITLSGDVTLSTGNLIPSTAAKGVNFTANTPAAGMTSQLLNWYEEGTWTPVLTCVTPGDLAITFTSNSGNYTRTGNRVNLVCNIVTSSFTYTTASGNLRIDNFPFTMVSTQNCVGNLIFQGITKVGYTQINSQLTAGSTHIGLFASASGLATSQVTIADLPTAGSVILRINLQYEVV
jgi:hypothetical protein